MCFDSHCHHPCSALVNLLFNFHSSPPIGLPFSVQPLVSNDHTHIIKIISKLYLHCPDWCGSVSWVSSGKGNGHRYTPRLRDQSGCNRSCFSLIPMDLSLSPPSFPSVLKTTTLPLSCIYSKGFTDCPLYRISSEPLI